VTSTEFEVKKEFARQAQDYQTLLKRKATALTASAALAYTPYKRQLKSVEDVEKPGLLSKAIVKMDDGLEMAGNTLAELMTTYETSVQDLSMGLRALEYKANTIRDTLGAPNLGISRELATPMAWGTIASLSNKVEEFGSIEIVTPHKLANEIAKSE
jgi:hypothetical protein